jgi:hypothetical protein
MIKREKGGENEKTYFENGEKTKIYLQIKACCVWPSLTKVMYIST